MRPLIAEEANSTESTVVQTDSARNTVHLPTANNNGHPRFTHFPAYPQTLTPVSVSSQRELQGGRNLFTDERPLWPGSRHASSSSERR